MMAGEQTIKRTACQTYWDMDLLRKHLDLFSGIGGFALAARWAGIETIGFCEIDKYAQKVLEKNFPGVPIYEDVTKLDGSEFKDIFLITGGFPCQDISIAGKGAGIEGERSGLWSELFRIIGEVRPKYALIENVPALTFRGGTRVIGDLTEIGYDTEWQIVGADDVGAPHRRKRIWIVAYPNGSTDKSQVTGKDGLKGKEKECIGEGNSTSRDTAGTSGNVRGETTFRHETEQDVAYSNSKREIGNKSEYREGCGFESRSEDVAHSNPGFSNRKDQEICTGGNSPDNGSKDVAYSNSKRGCLWKTNREDAENVREPSRCEEHGQWNPEPGVGRVAHGIPRRVDRLKGLGNAIVPQVAYEFLRLLRI